MRLISRIITLSFFVLQLAGADEFIELKNSQGKAIRAELLSLDGDSLRIRRVDGRPFTLSLSQLSTESQDLVRDALEPEPNLSSSGTITLAFTDQSHHRSGVPVPMTDGSSTDRHHTHGGKRMLAIRALRETEDAEAIERVNGSAQELKRMYEQLDRYWLFSSYGKLWVDTVTVAPVVTISDEVGSDPKVAAEAARNAAAKALSKSDFKDLENIYDFVTVIFAREQRLGAGLGAVRGKKAKLGDFRYSTLIHELSHNLGQGPHFDAWIPKQREDPIGGLGVYLPSGHPYSSLGGFQIENKNTLTEPLQAKQRFGWVTMGPKSADIQIVKNSGRYRINRFDVNEPHGVLGLLIDRPGSALGGSEETKVYSHYLLSFVASKTAITEQPDPVNNSLVATLGKAMGTGLVVERVEYDKEKGLLTRTCIVDCTYEKEAKLVTRRNLQAAEALSNCFLQEGETLMDEPAGISITVVSIGGTGSNRYIDVDLELK